VSAPGLRRAGGPLIGLGLLTLIVAFAALAAGAATPTGHVLAEPVAARPVATDPALVARGQELYLTSCVSCHGVGGAGTRNGPPLLESGEAAADFYLRTGRMPLAVPGPQPPQKPVAYDDAQIRALVAYVGSIGTGPPIPVVDPSRGDLDQGAELYLANCAACHNSAGIGGALSHGNYAPSLQNVATEQIAEAMRVGPGQMPRFGPDVLDEHQLNSVVRYVKYLHAPDDPGGLDLGYTGPVPEGFVAFLFGLGALIVAARWITREKDEESPTGEDPAGAEKEAAHRG
jgi:ubiquinol-cytochrome c reductase cytochrome c subunit